MNLTYFKTVARVLLCIFMLGTAMESLQAKQLMHQLEHTGVHSGTYVEADVLHDHIVLPSDSIQGENGPPTDVDHQLLHAVAQLVFSPPPAFGWHLPVQAALSPPSMIQPRIARTSMDAPFRPPRLPG